MSMSISGLSPRLPDPIGSPNRQAGVDPNERPAGGQERAGSEQVGARPAADLSRTPQAADPEMWALLSQEERGFYLRHAVTGPATYDPAASSNDSPAPGHRLGGRIDLRI
ncbi:MAG: hypothetical protein AAF389_02260 [Gemmatimonadota bacterium]